METIGWIYLQTYAPLNSRRIYPLQFFHFFFFLLDEKQWQMSTGNCKRDGYARILQMHQPLSIVTLSCSSYYKVIIIIRRKRSMFQQLKKGKLQYFMKLIIIVILWSDNIINLSSTEKAKAVAFHMSRI